jgi:hypothetical protein
MIKPTPQLSVVGGASQMPSRATASLLEKLRQAVLLRLEPVCTETITKSDDALFDMGQNSKGASAAAYMDAMREIRRERGPMELLFRNYINSSFHEFQQTPGSALVSTDKQALSLVAEEDLEEQLAGEQTANAIHRRFKQFLEPIAGGLARIAITINPMFDQANSPVGPERLVGAFRAALTGFSAPTEVKLVLAKLYERQVMPSLEVLYPEVHRILGEAGYISGVAPKPQPPQAQTQTQAEQQAQVAAILGEQAAQHGLMPGMMSGIPIPQHFFGYGGYQGTDSEVSVLNSLHDLLLAWRKVQRPDYATIYQPPAAPSRPALTPNEMLSVLGLFQVDLPVGLKTALQSTDNLSQQIKRELITGAAALGISQHDAHIGDAEEDAIDVVGMMFEVFLDDRDIDAGVRDQLARLLVPYVKVALIDRRLFLHKTHPARKLLNAISEACQGNHGEGPNERELLQKVESVTERLVAGFSEDMGIFDTLEAELRLSIEQYKKRAELAERRVTEAQRGKERLEEARLRAEGLLNQRLQNRQVTDMVQEDLHRYWSHHYAVVFLRENGEGEGCTQALHTLDQMLALADAAFHTGGLTAQGAPDALKPGLLTMLSSSGLADAAAEECARVISQHLLQPPVKTAAPSPSVPAPAPVQASPSNDSFGNALDASMATLSAKVDRMMLAETDPAAAQSAATAPATEPTAEAAAQVPAAPAVAAAAAPAKAEPAPPAPLEFDHIDVERMRKLTVGTWVEFIGDDDRITPGKLSWISPISQRMLFVNRRGARMHVASVEELASMMKAGHLRLRVADTAFEQAMQQVLGKLKEGAGAVDQAAIGAG